MTVGDDTATLSDCGCKGARYCAACMHTARVQALQHTPSSDADILRQFDTVLIWCNECAAAFPASYTVDPADIDSVARAAADCTQHRQTAVQTGTSMALIVCRHVISSSGVHVDGLIVCLDLLSEEEEADIVRRIDRTHWMPSQSGRRKQDYGPKVLHSFSYAFSYAFLCRLISRSARYAVRRTKACPTTGVSCSSACARACPISCTTTRLSSCAIWSTPAIDVPVSSGTATTNGSGATGACLLVAAVPVSLTQRTVQADQR